MKNDKTDNHEQIFWEEIDRLFPDMIKAIASLSKKIISFHHKPSDRNHLVVRTGDGLFWHERKLYDPQHGKGKPEDPS